MIKRITYFLLLVLLAGQDLHAQTITDSAGREVALPPADAPRADTMMISPRRASIRSAIIPGWGQVSVRRNIKDASFFRKYYSIPIIYGAIGTSAAVFAYNLTWYRRTRFAYKTLVNRDTSNFRKVHPDLQFLVNRSDLGGLQNARNEYRRNVDYSALVVLVFWGLNVVHASVEAHLITFDVSSDLGLRLRGGYSEMAQTNGVSLILSFK